MPEITESFLRDQLVARRQRLESTANAVGLQGLITGLLSEIDAALEPSTGHRRSNWHVLGWAVHYATFTIGPR